MQSKSYGIGIQFYGGKLSQGMVLSAQVTHSFSFERLTHIKCKKRYVAKNDYTVEYSWEKNFVDFPQKLDEILTLVDAIVAEGTSSTQPKYGPKENCGRYIIVNDQKLFVVATKNWEELANLLKLDVVINEDIEQTLKKINGET